MNPEYPFVKPRRHPNSLVLVVYLRNAPCRRLRRNFFARMHAEARRLGMVMSHKLGVCVLFGAERVCGSAHRHQIVNWLMDQPEAQRVDIGQLRHLGDLFLPRLHIEGLDGPLHDQEREGARRLMRRLGAGAVAQWVQYLQGRLS
jgi:hypothetical protein